MSGIISRKFRVHNAEQFFEQFLEADPSFVYFFIGRSHEWPDEDNPPIATDVVENIDYVVWDEILAMKRITGADAIFAAPRREWESGHVFDMYRVNTTFHTGNNFYTFTDDFNVYKCLDNNGGFPSTSKPTSTSMSPFRTSDGYLWKFMFSVSAPDSLKFLTGNFIPVKTLESDDGTLQWNVQQTAVNSSIEVVEVTGLGSGYRYNQGTAQGGSNTSIILASSASDEDDFYNDYMIFIRSGPAVGDFRKIESYAGASRTASIEGTFSEEPTSISSYEIGVNTIINGNGEGFEGYANVTSDQLNKVVVLESGQDYSQAEVVFEAGTGTGGAGIAHISPIGGHGSDAVKELMAHNVMMNVRLTGAEGSTFPVGNNFRIVGLLVDPIDESTGNVANSLTYNMTTRIVLESVSGDFENNEQVEGANSGATGFVVSFDDGSNTLSVTSIQGSFIEGELIEGSATSETGISNTIINPETILYSGDIIYYENRIPITRAEDQQEDVKILVRF